jgi:2-amino-4-hydroxy-6-hydroxymethyldihydropteridine diphosphokinase
MIIAYIGIGSNLGDRFINLSTAIDLLNEKCGVGKVSSVYETEPVGFDDQPFFLNCVAEISTKLTPHRLLEELKGIERKMGRINTFLNSPRTIDLDILFYGEEIIESQELIIPHPRLQERAFVLVPLNEIAPNFIHPVLRKTINRLLDELVKIKEVKKWGSIGKGI